MDDVCINSKLTCIRSVKVVTEVKTCHGEQNMLSFSANQHFLFGQTLNIDELVYLFCLLSCHYYVLWMDTATTCYIEYYKS